MRPNRTQAKRRKARILIVDDHPIVREGLAQRIARQPGLEVCGEAEDVPGALRLIAELNPDAAVIDIGLKNGSGLDLVRRVKDRGDKVRMLVWSMYGESHFGERAIRAGALGFITKDQPAELFLEAIHCVLQGKVYLSDELAQEILRSRVGETEEVENQPLIKKLSDREMEVFRLMGLGRATREIADKMQLSPKTVETYVARIKEKLKLSNLRELLLFAAKWHEESLAK
jgi:DNA-binding NarL/FixJ family response regulator